MNELERIQRKIEQQKSLIATIEANMYKIPEQSRNNQMILLQLIKGQLTNLEQITSNL